jgi:dihydrofolate reductase
MIISQIAATSLNHVIGKNNQLPWHMPTDMAYFKKKTIGHTILMGRKSYESEGKALPKRRNIVITRDENYSLDDANVVSSFREGIQLAEDAGENELFITGGGEIYEQSLYLTNRIYLTVIEVITPGDVFFPLIDFNEWKVVSKDAREKDDKNPYHYTFYIFERRI